MRANVGIDLETFSSVNLKVHGLDRYVNSPDFTILMASFSFPTQNITYDLVFNPEQQASMIDSLRILVGQGAMFSAHNVGFEKASLRKLRIPNMYLDQFIDSAVIARSEGAASSLYNASRQLLPTVHKLDTGSALIQKFCVPNEWNDYKAPTAELIMADQESMDQWTDFRVYCEVDAQASREIVDAYHPDKSEAVYREWQRERLTARMNEYGWKVDMPLVKHMQVRYKENVLRAKADFRARYDQTGSLNFASVPQLKAWCAERGVKASGFDQDKVAALVKKMHKKLDSMKGDEPRYEDYTEVYEMLHTKQIIGGSSLKKLQTIIDTVGDDGRLRNQYLHCGAGQTYRTSGRGVQMQNLKRLKEDLLDMDSVFDDTLELSNDVLGANLRQVFTASHRDGALIVGDFSSVESRGLAWLAGADWKIQSYRDGKDMYKVLASKLYGIPYEEVTKPQRQMGKLGELSCGYGAGKIAVGGMADRQGLVLTEEEVAGVVSGWRETNPEVTELWNKLDVALHEVVGGSPSADVELAHNLLVRFEAIKTPRSLLDIHANARSLRMSLHTTYYRTDTMILERVFHGCYLRGKNVAYYKPTELRSGALWSSHFMDPKTKQTRFWEVYGGKLTGILTQSMCREIFFMAVDQMDNTIAEIPNAALVGQFHDELVVDWVPAEVEDPKRPPVTREQMEKLMEEDMTYVDPMFRGFPLGADIKYGYRYIK